MMLQSGMPILTSLGMLEHESHTLLLKRITESLINDVASGVSLSSALHKYPRSFDTFCINMITVGEVSGTLPLNLEYIAKELKKKHELRKQIVGALLYPLIIILATVAITTFLILYIFPKILPIFTSLHVELPLSTRILISLSDFLKAEWYIVCIFVVLSVLAYPRLRNIYTFRYATDSLLIRLPIFGRLGIFYNLSNILRTLGLLLQYHVPITQALHITAESTNHVVYRKILEDAVTGVTQGQLLSLQLQSHHLVFPPLCISMIQAGEATGNLSTTLEYVSAMYEADMHNWTKNLTTVLEPVLMLAMGLCVGFIAVSIITPIYGITQNLHQ